MKERRKVSLENRIFYFIPSLIVLVVWSIYMTLSEQWFMMIDHWTISLTMVFGSLVAGATSEGGGAVAFPVFTKVLHISPEIARTFSLAIQTFGMGTASIVIFKYRIPIIRSAIIYASLAGVLGFIVGALWIAPFLAGAYFKIAFTILTLSFGFVLYMENRTISTERFDTIQFESRFNPLLLMVAGFLGGICTSIVGNGIDFLTFSLLVIYFNISEKVATPTSVVLMAVNAAFGFWMHGAVLNTFQGVTVDYWLVCVPIVIFGAPLGAMLCARISREGIINFLLALILIEFVSTIIIVPFDLTARIFAPVLFFTLIGAFFILNRMRMRRLRAMGLLPVAGSDGSKQNAEGDGV